MSAPETPELFRSSARHVVLSYGMGVDSTAILVRWLTEPSSRDFPLEDLIVLTAQTGDEFIESGNLVGRYVLPLLQRARVRFVEVARSGPLERDGITVLQDCRSATRLHLEGDYPLSAELMTAGTVPTVKSGQRHCTLKYKGWVLDSWKVALQGESYRHAIGFNADELSRVERDRSYTSATRQAIYPLVEWGWGRAQCEAYLEERLGVRWPKSCCVYCPFAGGNAAHLERYRAEPEAAVRSLLVEYLSRMLNPRMTLYPRKSLLAVLQDDGNHSALEGLEQALTSFDEWALYRVRRAYVRAGVASRSLEVIHQSSRAAVLARLQTLAEARQAPVEDLEDIPRITTLQREPDTYPTAEETYVVGPALVSPKVKAATFERRWRAALARRGLLDQTSEVQPALL